LQIYDQKKLNDAEAKEMYQAIISKSFGKLG
jgi:hypothetical protein